LKNSAYTLAVDNMEKVLHNFKRQNHLSDEDHATLSMNLLILKMMPYYGGELRGVEDLKRRNNET